MRPFFPPRSLALGREMNVENLTDYCDVYQWHDDERDLFDANIPCRVGPVDLRVPGVSDVASQYGPDARWVVIFEAGYKIATGMELHAFGSTNGTPWVLDLVVLGPVFRDTDILARVVCKTLPVARGASL